MSASMTLPKTNPQLDVTYKEVQDFMVPSSVGEPFKNAPGTFDKMMEPRLYEAQMGGMMVFDRKGMAAAGAPHNKGITFRPLPELNTCMNLMVNAVESVFRFAEKGTFR